MEMYERLSKARKVTGMTQDEVAKYLKQKQPYYARFENGERNLPREKLIEIAKLFHVSTDYLLGLTDEMKPYPPSKE